MRNRTVFFFAAAFVFSGSLSKGALADVPPQPDEVAVDVVRYLIHKQPIPTVITALAVVGIAFLVWRRMAKR